MSVLRHTAFWIAASCFLLLFIWIFNDVLLPFVLGIVIAYLLNPLILMLGKIGVPRVAASLLILTGFFLFIVTVIVLIAPPLYREATQLAGQLPEYVETIRQIINPYVKSIEDTLGTDDLNESLTQAVQSNVGSAVDAGVTLFGSLMSGGQVIFSFFFITVVTPLVAFFVMSKWEAVTDWIDKILPRHSYQEVKSLLADIDKSIGGFIRGQLLVAAILGSLYALALTIAGLNYGFLIGLMAGALSIIPLVGSTTGLLVGVFVGWFQTGEWTFIATIAAIFLAGQFLEGNFITPKLVGDSVGLHPVWVLFAITAGGTLFGIVGMLIAVPVAAIVAVLSRFIIEKYMKSSYYH